MLTNAIALLVHTEDVAAEELLPVFASVVHAWNREDIFASSSDLFIWARTFESEGLDEWTNIRQRDTWQTHITFTNESLVFHSTSETIFLDSGMQGRFSLTNFTLQNLVWEPGTIQEFIMPNMPLADRSGVADYPFGYRITGTVSNIFRNRWPDNNSTMTVYVFLHKDDPSRLLWVRYFSARPTPFTQRMDKMAIDSSFLAEMERIIEAQKTEEELRLRGPFLDAVGMIEFSPDSSQIVTTTENGPIILWDLATGREVKRFIGHVDPRRLAFTSAGRQIISASNQTIKLWDIETGNQVWTYTLPIGYFSMLSFSPTGRQIFVVMSRGHVILDASTGKEAVQEEAFPEIMNRHRRGEGFSPDGRYRLSGEDDGTFKLFDAQTGNLIRTFSATSEEYIIRSAIFSLDGRFIVSRNQVDWRDWFIVLWDAQTGNEIRRFTGYQDIFARFCANSRYLVVGHFHYRKTIWDVASWEIIMTLGGEEPPPPQWHPH